MQVYGVDLSAWWASRRWRSLLELIEELPPASRLNEAILNDPEQAARIAQLPESTEEWSPKVRDYDLTATLLREIRELLVSIYYTSHLSATGKPARNVKPLPTPVTEVNRARARDAADWADSIIARATPQYAGRRVV